MNDAHLHLIVNHFPIVGTIFGAGILVVGLFLKNNIVKNIAYSLFMVTAIFGFLSIYTGEGAEEIVEDFPNIGKKIIHEHEELAEKLALILYILGAFSMIGLYSNFKNHAKSSLISVIVLILALISLFFVQQTSTSGGEIRHTEIRANATPNQAE